MPNHKKQADFRNSGRQPIGPPARAAAPFSLPWWCYPSGLTLGFLLPVLVLISTLHAFDHPGLTVRGVIFLTPHYVALGAALLLVLACGAWFGGHLVMVRARRAPLPQASWDLPALVLGVITVAAYCLWFKEYVFNPVLLWQTLTGASTPSRDLLELTTGLTSLANLTPVFFAVASFRWMLGTPEQPMPTSLKAMGVALFLFVLFRAFAWSERLAVIEAVAPIGLAAFFRLARDTATRSARQHKNGLARVRSLADVGHLLLRGLLKLGPYLGIPVVIAIFGTFEFFRSWTSSTYKDKSGFLDFAVGRFLSYYYTALNNGAGLLTVDEPSYRLDYVLGWAHRFLFSFVPDQGRGEGFYKHHIEVFLRTYADPEFNSPSLFAVVVDLGLPLAFLYMFLLGIAGGLACRAYRSGSLTGVLLYPTLVVTFMELFRYPYLGESRAFTAVLGMGLVLGLAKLGHEWLTPQRVRVAGRPRPRNQARISASASARPSAARCRHAFPPAAPAWPGGHRAGRG